MDKGEDRHEHSCRSCTYPATVRCTAIPAHTSIEGQAGFLSFRGKLDLGRKTQQLQDIQAQASRQEFHIVLMREKVIP